MSMKKQLQDVHERIMAVKYPDKGFAGLLQHELLPIIEESEILKKEFERRILYYERLTKDASYLELIANIHKEIIALQKLIDPSKLPDSPRLFKPKHDDPEKNEPWIAMKDLHSILNKEDTWWRLGEVTVHQVDDHVRTPWRPIVRQYEIFTALVNHAYSAGALSEKEADPHIASLQTYLGDLERRLEQPFVRLHIRDFDFLDHYMRDPRWIGNDEKSWESVKKYVDRVCKDFLMFLDEQEDKHRHLVVLQNWQKEEQEKRKKLKQDYKEMLKEVDLPALEKKYKNNPAVQVAIERITSPAFLDEVGSSIRYQQQLYKQFSESVAGQMKALQEVLDASGFKRMQEQAAAASKQFKAALDAAKPYIEAFQVGSNAVADNTRALSAALNTAVPSIVDYGRMLSEQNPLIQELGRNAALGGITALPALSVSSSVPVLPPDAVIITREEYLEYQRLKARYETEIASEETDKKLEEWRGDKDISYNSTDRLLQIGDVTRLIPKSQKSEKRRVLLQMLVEMYSEKDEGMGITTAGFCSKLNGLGINTKDRERILETAVGDLKSEVKEAFGITRFIRLRAGTAEIPKQR